MLSEEFVFNVKEVKFIDFEYLNKCDKVYSVEETVEYMEEILEQYEQSI